MNDPPPPYSLDAPRPWTRGAASTPSSPVYAPQSSSNALLDLPPRPPHLRPSRSATNLSQGAQYHQERGVIDRDGDRLVDFVVDEAPTPQPSRQPAGFLDPSFGQRPQEIRRVQSSSVLSINSPTALHSPHSPHSPLSPVTPPLPSATFPQSFKPPTSEGDSKWKNALGEAQYFAGGLISHPAESTKHYTIIRHSHALVWYRGPETSITITILSSESSPLPDNRTLWLQQKGYSGNMGMSLKALVGTTSSWIDVTPARKATLQQIPEMDERGIQRDLKRFYKKASGKIARHIARETHIVRIPASCVDGYFRLALCCGDEGKKLLVGSPVFRVASTSTEMSVTRGASVSTMPLEFGVKVGSIAAQQVAKRYAGVAGAVVQSKAARAIPNAAFKKVVSTAYSKSGAQDMVKQSWQNGKAGRYNPMVNGDGAEGMMGVVGSDEGPEHPFPVNFEGKVVQGTGWSTREIGVPTANLREVDDEVKMRLKGVFCAWASILPKYTTFPNPEWHPSIVTIAPPVSGDPGIVVKNKVSLHILSSCPPDMIGFRLKVILMAYLHPPNALQDPDLEHLVNQHNQDMMVTLGSLQRENWEPEMTVERTRTLKSERSFGDRLDGATAKVQNGVDRIPLHKVGVRSEAATMRDEVYGIGGLWIPR